MSPSSTTTSSSPSSPPQSSSPFPVPSAYTQPGDSNSSGSGAGTGSGFPSFPPTPSRTTSKLSITSVDAHLSPPQPPSHPSSAGDVRKRSHSNPTVRAISPHHLSLPSTPTKSRRPLNANANGNGLLHVNGNVNSDTFPKTLTLRKKSSASTASSIHSVSLFDGVHTHSQSHTPSGIDTPTSGLSRGSAFQEDDPIERRSHAVGNTSGSRSRSGENSRTPQSGSSKGKERATDVDADDNNQSVEGGISGLTDVDDIKTGLKELGRADMAGHSVEGDIEGSMSRLDLKDTKDDPQTSETVSAGISDTTRYAPRRYYVLTNAGKPVFSSHDDTSEDNITNLMAIASTLISIFQEEDDKIRCIIKGKSRIGFVLKPPLYLFAVSDWGEPEHVLRSHLEYIHLHILSVVSSTQLSRVFQRRSNFDLSRLLEGTETFLNNLIDHSQFDFSYLTATLQPLRMNPATRDVAGAALMPPSKFKDLLYVLLIANGRIVTLLRPRKHAVHPSDLHLLLNTLASSATLRSSETWLPICFPKFNPAGFVHAYISYMTEDVGLVFVSADREAFEDLRNWKSIVLQKLEVDKTLSKISESIPLHPYTVSAVGCPGLRHFIYKSRQYIQLTQPEWEAPYTEKSVDRKRLITMYQKLHDVVHARSGQNQTYKLVYMRTEHEACLAWLTKPFELYLTVSPQLSKSAVVSTANAVAKWVLAEEGRVFLKDAPVF
ncbi:uncharacterized protein I303_101977 [Kwoniella dejecticola CBS 10117]|uniref:Vacuolar fusion protein MON1 n=1 Tax=Kwoniella dejecticola CBS 10117 TaxID=1296121 RepID=A0A1A6ACB1_9TREE|nr:vacuolar fusion protein MON1 [Kwoniella dejecticola CBS 10117]OBR87678.1 vacuolar fusion protein MON1 [Kwoniella dejecticola CBS 10117]